MKNKEKIQILVNRLNTHAELLDKIITKLELDNAPQLKQLDQSVFKNMHEKWRFAAIDADGSAHRFNKEVFPYREGFCYEGDDYSEFKYSLIGTGYVAIDWKNSLIKRETIELTGSELCKAMLARGDTRIMCRVYDIDRQHDITHVIRAYRDGKFHTKANRWTFAIPINNQGEPLTSSDVGLY